LLWPQNFSECRVADRSARVPGGSSSVHTISGSDRRALQARLNLP
jgi:hypothetical protein